ncbi:copper amine oxidase N-terminal domain-containing protein [Paenibacillus spiritus]|uniref:Copper amine oxidase N-terminal domain-containing protein n=1 Tax=Paenibacillus spiritus TaxID=2496557 RepID=A0A5J5G481_9BACL|nr:copper amine oxidase N-terminal domain-containing protein [Paenibacillus spiritus]KAA9001014.1 copper amine oxidase N-terminal domain-containing protein [Paenibacillus spiritus]
MNKLKVLLALTVFGLAVCSENAAVSAQSAAPIGIVVNDKLIPTDSAPYLARDTVMVPLSAVQSIPGLRVSWNNATKQVTVSREGIRYVLRPGSQQAVSASGTSRLPAAPALKNGRIMVPLRFIAEAGKAHVAWNPHTRTVYVARAGDELAAKLKSADLAEARTAALHMPETTSLREVYQWNGGENQSQDYYFPEGRADACFIAFGGTVRYYRIGDHYRELVWTARMSGTKADRPALFFLPYTMEDQDGVQPQIKGRVAFYHLMLPIMEAGYGFVETNGTAATLGQKDMKLDTFFNIPEEKN